MDIHTIVSRLKVDIEALVEEVDRLKNSTISLRQENQELREELASIHLEYSSHPWRRI